MKETLSHLGEEKGLWGLGAQCLSCVAVWSKQ